MEKFTVTLTPEQVRILLGLIDDHTDEHEPAFFLDETNGLVSSPMVEAPSARTVQEHLDEYLNREKLDY